MKRQIIRSGIIASILAIAGTATVATAAPLGIAGERANSGSLLQSVHGDGYGRDGYGYGRDRDSWRHRHDHDRRPWWWRHRSHHHHDHGYDRRGDYDRRGYGDRRW